MTLAQPEMGDLRTAIGQSLQTKSPLVEKSAVADCELEAVTTYISPREITTINGSNVEAVMG
jgi:hypothetical protein